MGTTQGEARLSMTRGGEYTNTKDDLDKEKSVWPGKEEIMK